MSRLIDADVLSDKIKKWLSGDITGEKLENVINDDCVVSLLQEIYEAPTVDIIDFADYKKTVSQLITSDYCNGWNDAIAEISKAEWKRVFHAKWKLDEDASSLEKPCYRCSNCGAVLEEDYKWHNHNFCYNCGARMDDEENESS